MRQACCFWAGYKHPTPTPKTGFLYTVLAVLNPLCGPSWPQTHRDPAAFASQWWYVALRPTWIPHLFSRPKGSRLPVGLQASLWRCGGWKGRGWDRTSYSPVLPQNPYVAQTGLELLLQPHESWDSGMETLCNTILNVHSHCLYSENKSWFYLKTSLNGRKVDSTPSICSKTVLGPFFLILGIPLDMLLFGIWQYPHTDIW